MSCQLSCLVKSPGKGVAGSLTAVALKVPRDLKNESEDLSRATFDDEDEILVIPGDNPLGR